MVRAATWATTAAREKARGVETRMVGWIKSAGGVAVAVAVGCLAPVFFVKGLDGLGRFAQGGQTRRMVGEREEEKEGVV